jgi:hypothetical protein
MFAPARPGLAAHSGSLIFSRRNGPRLRRPVVLISPSFHLTDFPIRHDLQQRSGSN